MDTAKPQNERPTYKQLEDVIRGHKGVDKVFDESLNDLAAISWLAHHAHGSDKPGYLEENYEHFASAAFRFIYTYLVDRTDSFLRTKDLVEGRVLGNTSEEADNA